MKKLLFLLVFIPLVSFGQDYGNNSDAIKLCSVLQTNNFGTDAGAERGLDRILAVIGASKRFVLQPCDNINNAVAASYKGIRYIFYDRDFMSSINSGNNWGNLFILAHEVGHHINGHSLDLVLYAADVVEPETLANQRKQELEADEFAGFVLAKLGGPISAANQIISRISTNSDDSYSTHPSRDKRISSVRKGYAKTGYLISNSETPILNYSLINENNNNDFVNEWDNVVSNEKEKKLENISDPFKRMEIISDNDIPDKKNISWVNGKILGTFDSPLELNFSSSKLVVVQEKYDSQKKTDYYNNTTIYFYDSFFVQKILTNYGFISDVKEYLINGKFEFEYLFDDGTKGVLKAIPLGEKPWMLQLKLSTELSFNELNVAYAIFLDKLQTQNKLFIKLTTIDPYFKYMVKNRGSDYDAIDVIDYVRTHEFSLMGSSKALNFN